MKILVVDDDALAAEMTAAVVEALGHEAVCAENALEGAEQLNGEDGFALIISDMNMPLMDGIAFFRLLRAEGNDLPFVLLTGDDPTALAAEEPGLDACLMKDFGLEDHLAPLLTRLGAGRS